MTYTEAVNFLYEKLPMFHREGKTAYKANLDNIITLDNALSSPHKHYKTIHIAGTNGKGSVSHMLASVLQESGFKTGLFTSPHLIDFRERIKINGKMISRKGVIDFIEKNIKIIETVKPSFFEVTTAMAFDYFNDNHVDFAVIETGLGGRLDSTNIIHPTLCIITNISLDHTDILGNTIEAIAFEKAGIIKENTPVIIGESVPESKKVFIQTSLTKNAEIYFSEEKYQTAIKLQKENLQLIEIIDKQNKTKDEYTCDMLGIYQQKNIATALTALDILSKETMLSQENIRKGLCNIAANTGLMGRWQILNNTPLVIVDTGHNEAGIKFVVNQLENTPANKKHIVFGMVNDKDPSKVLCLLPKDACYYFTKANIPRALNENTLLELSLLYNLKGEAFKTVDGAIKKALTQANDTDVVFIGGSTFIVAEALTNNFFKKTN